MSECPQCGSEACMSCEAGAELTRRNAQLVEALDDIYRVPPMRKANGHTSWIRTCNYMRGRSAVALASVSKAEE